MELLFKNFKALLLDKVDKVTLHDGVSEEYIIEFSDMEAERRLLREIFCSTDLDDFMADGIMVSGTGFSICGDNTPSNRVIFDRVAYKYGLTINHKIYTKTYLQNN